MIRQAADGSSGDELGFSNGVESVISGLFHQARRKECRLAVEDIPRPSRQCFSSGRSLKPGERYRTELRQTDHGWERRDFSLEHAPAQTDEPAAWWDGELPPGPQAALNARELDARLLALVEQWGTSSRTNDDKRRYAAVMLLAGRKALKLQEITRSGDRDWLVFAHGRGKPSIQVADLGLNDEELKHWQAKAVELAQNAP